METLSQRTPHLLWCIDDNHWARCYAAVQCKYNLIQQVCGKSHLHAIFLQFKQLSFCLNSTVDMMFSLYDHLKGFEEKLGMYISVQEEKLWKDEDSLVAFYYKTTNHVAGVNCALRFDHFINASIHLRRTCFGGSSDILLPTFRPTIGSLFHALFGS